MTLASRVQSCTCLSTIVAGDAIDIIGNRVVQLFFISTLADFPIHSWNVASVALAIFLLHLELPRHHTKLGEHNIHPIRNKENSEQQNLIGQRGLVSSKWQLEDS